jgi:hypothetical protein
VLKNNVLTRQEVAGAFIQESIALHVQELKPNQIDRYTT